MAEPRFLAPLLVAREFAATLAFYRNLLGLPFTGDAPPYAECRTERSLLAIFDAGFLGESGEIDVPRAAVGAGSSHTLISLEVDDLTEVFERLVAQGVRFLAPPSDRLPLGRKYAALRDPDGRIVVLFGPRPVAD